MLLLEQQNLVPIFFFFHSLGLKGQKYTVSHVQIYLHDTWHAFFTLLLSNSNSYEFVEDEVRLPVPHFEAYFVTYRISTLLSSFLEKVLRSEKLICMFSPMGGNCIEILHVDVVYQITERILEQNGR